MKLSISSVLATAALCCLFAAAPAAANDRFVLDPEPATPGRVIEDAAGNAYVAWTHDTHEVGPDQTMFCKVPPGGTCTNPIVLPIPGATEASGAFPVFGPAGTVYVVGPRYVANDVVVWTSTDGGQSFDGGTAIAGAYSEKTNPSDVLLRGTSFLISADNYGLGFSEAPTAGGLGANFSFAAPGADSLAGSTMALDEAGNPVEAYWNLSSPYTVNFYRYGGTGPLASESSWAGPSTVASGYEPRLAGGASGLFMVDQEYSSPTAGDPTAVTLRKYAGGAFGPGRVLFDDPSASLFAGGAIAESPSGRLAIAWPSVAGNSMMRLFSSSDGGATFTVTDVAHLGERYGIGDNADLAVGDDGSGWLTFRNGSGLQMADLTPVPVPPPPAPPAGGGAASSTPPIYRGSTKVTSTTLAGNRLTLTVPRGCLRSRQPFFVGVGKKAQRKVKRALRGQLKILSVTFRLDGRKLATKKKKPFREVVSPGALASGSKHTVTASVTVRVSKHGHHKRVVRTLTGTVSVC